MHRVIFTVCSTLTRSFPIKHFKNSPLQTQWDLDSTTYQTCFKQTFAFNTLFDMHNPTLIMNELKTNQQKFST